MERVINIKIIGNSLQYFEGGITIFEGKFWEFWLLWTAPSATFLIGLILAVIAYHYFELENLATFITIGGFLASIFVFMYYNKKSNSNMNE